MLLGDAAAPFVHIKAVGMDSGDKTVIKNPFDVRAVEAPGR
ncbi:hypothetical protein ACTAQI_06025 [Pseudarthrobacter sp. alpha12b]